ncbi:XRE family transcriptional regulator [bacterium]|nr:XRE family transcriptional regulator [bacterium]
MSWRKPLFYFKIRRLNKEYDKLLLRVASNIKKIRHQLELTQEEVSSKGGFNTRFYQKLESGRYSPNLYTLFRLASTLKVKITDLFK